MTQGSATYTGLMMVSGGTLAVGSTGSLNSGNALTVGLSGTATFGNDGQTLGTVSNANSLSFTETNGTATLTSLGGLGGTTNFTTTPRLRA